MSETNKPKARKVAATRDRDPAQTTQDRQIARALISDIMEWRIAPGSWIREREVAERFATSHAPVREALRQVARAGFVELIPYRGARVVDLDALAAEEAFQVWRVLYGVVCRSAAAAFDGDREELLRKLDAYERIVAETADPGPHIPVAFDLGHYITVHCGGSLAPQMFTQVGRIVRWQHNLLTFEGVARLRPDARFDSARAHRRMVEGVLAGDPDEAEAGAHEVIEVTSRLLLHLIKERIATHARRKRRAA